VTPRTELQRNLRSRITLEVVDPTAFMLAISTARGVPITSEQLEVRIGGDLVATRELDEVHGTRQQLFETGPGILEIVYRATVVGRADPLPVEATDEITYLRPSRYVQSDIMQPFARETFAGLEGATLVRAIGAWVHDRLTYVPEASTPTGGAVETLEAGAGVCRDYAHLTAALLRALDVPARLVSVYAPLLQPPDFHAVVEAVVDGRWVVVDSTRLAPRRGMVRMATGRDAADTAFLTNTMADILFRTLEVSADADVEFGDDPDELVELS
jgi:transglutaminase-like putative cysteine protease